MITVIAQFKLPQTITRERARETFLSTAPKYKGVPGLIRKYYILSQDGGTAGGIYLWNSREDADRLCTEDWKNFVLVARACFERRRDTVEACLIVLGFAGAFYLCESNVDLAKFALVLAGSLLAGWAATLPLAETIIRPLSTAVPHYLVPELLGRIHACAR
jgi:hypothetical protein